MSVDIISELADSVRTEEGAKLCRMSRANFIRKVLTGQIRSIKSGKNRFIPRSAIREYLEAGVNVLPTRKAPPRRSEAQRKAASHAAAERAKAMGC
jgi:hypothetical protein